MATKRCTELEVAWKRCPIVFQGHTSKMIDLTSGSHFATLQSSLVIPWYKAVKHLRTKIRKPCFCPSEIASCIKYFCCVSYKNHHMLLISFSYSVHFFEYGMVNKTFLCWPFQWNADIQSLARFMSSACRMARCRHRSWSTAEVRSRVGGFQRSLTPQ